MKVEDSALHVLRAFERLGVRHYVGGSLASSLHGDPRFTNDADIVAELFEPHIRRLQQELGERFYVDEESVRFAIRNERSFNLIDEIELAKVDVFCVRGTGYQAEALARVVRMELEVDDPFTIVSVASPADTILAKLRWYRMGNEISDRQWADILGVAKTQQGKLELDYLWKWAKEQGTLDLLERLLIASSTP